MARIRIGEFVADPESNEVVCPDGAAIHLEPKVMAILCALAKRPGQVVTREQLIDEIWGVEHGADERLTRAVSILRKVFNGTRENQRYIETIPKRGYKLVAPVTEIETEHVSAPEAAESPTYFDDLEPADPAPGVSGRSLQDSPADGSNTGLMKHRWRLWPAGPIRMVKIQRPIPMLAIVLGAAIFAGWYLATGEPQPQQVRTATPMDNKIVAVLPFQNRSTREDDAYLADGFHDALLTQLSKLSAIKVISRASVVQYRDTTKQTRQIARELGAAVLLAGSVQRSAGQIRINVQLIDGAKDTHVWAEVYDRPLTPENLFDVQSEITRAIASALQTALTDADRVVLAELPTRNQSAYEAYFRGRIAWDWIRSSEAAWQQAISAYDEAIRLDPHFAEAYAGKAKTYLNGFWQFGRNPEYLQAADDAISQAERLAPEAVETLVARAYYYYWGFFDYEKSDALLKRALAKAPNNAEIWGAIGFVARRDGRFDDSLAAIENARRLDSRNASLITQLVFTHYVFGRLRLAQRQIALAKSIDPTSELVVGNAASFAHRSGNPELAWREYTGTSASLKLEWANNESGKCLAAWYLHDTQKIQSVLDEWPEAARRPDWNPEIFNLCRWRLLRVARHADQARALARKIYASLAARRDLIGWRQGQITPRFLASLTGDLNRLRAARAEYNALKLNDAWFHLFHLEAFGYAFARTGDPETAFDYFEDYAKRTSPSAFLEMSINPDLDGLRNHPRYLALKARYDSWAAENPDQLPAK